ncbi:3-isopropylmalate dehydratase large subunit [Ferrimicrobium sp.]|uniref:3-isopropylmalate dehydratase large subunit n=1 Tax=Ferrimicrobium sp. TaxID=2926050 RepID=UPI00261B4514|nr:3-isopropylmalate dehydratase large subunit [Ferrimicrobium sp.]
MGKYTLVERIWAEHVFDSEDLIYIDMHLLHELTSPQAFEGLRMSGRPVRRPDLTIATADHDVPTRSRQIPLTDEVSRRQLALQINNCREFGIELHPMNSLGQGIVHVIGPQMGLTLPGMTIVCGDSHTATHGAFGAIAFGIGTSQVEHVLATQTLRMMKPKSMAVRMQGVVSPEATPKDITLAMVKAIGTKGGTGHLIEFQGPVVEALSMEGRMTLCNMAIEAGARSGLVAPDEVTFAYLDGRDRVPKGDAWQKATAAWRTYRSEPYAEFDTVVDIDMDGLGPQVTWGTNPSQVADLDSEVPDPDQFHDAAIRDAARRALAYMNLRPGQRFSEIPLGTVFIGSCTNGRIEDLRAAANVLRGHKVAPGITALVVPGSEQVKREAEYEGLHEIFLEAGFEWRAPGCSMCIAMNGDRVASDTHAASTSNRNFEGRQGPGARTHLLSPESAAASAVVGRLATKNSVS